MTVEIAFRTVAEDAMRLSELLEAHGALAITFTDAEDDPIFEPKPDEIRIWPNTVLTALFDEPFDEEAICEAIIHEFSEFDFSCMTVKTIEEQAWERAWLDHFQPMQFGKNLWVVPTAFTPPNPDAVNVFLDPGLAFGTGTHSTTRLCLQYLETIDLTHKTVLDYGCGSGILAIAALKLGALRASAVDIDEQALIATRDNAEKNQVNHNLQIAFAETELDAADVVLANILAEPLIELSTRLKQLLKPNGILILSGLLTVQAEAVQNAYSDLKWLEHRTDDEWSLLVFQKRPFLVNLEF